MPARVLQRAGAHPLPTQIELAWLEALAAERAIRELKPFSRATKAAFAGWSRISRSATPSTSRTSRPRPTTTFKAIEYWLNPSSPPTAKCGDRSSSALRLHVGGRQQPRYALMVAESRGQGHAAGARPGRRRAARVARRHAALPMLSRTTGRRRRPHCGQGGGNSRTACAARASALPGSRSSERSTARGQLQRPLMAYPAFDWERFCRRFVERLGLGSTPTRRRSSRTTGSRSCSTPTRAPTACCRSGPGRLGLHLAGLFHQKLKKGEIGSSTMPPQVNPIDFENSRAM